MARLASPIDKIKPHYEVVVIGSGYGGGIAASRLSRAGKKVCLLERGKEFQPGEYPDTTLEAAEEFQIDLPTGHIGSKTGLYDMRVNEDMNVFQGCGLGGTSLVNANVSVRADARVFSDAAWPAEIRNFPGSLDEGYRLAEEMLKPQPYPKDFPELPKLKAQAKSAQHLGAPLVLAPINVTFESGLNHVGVEQKACVLCGDCVTGCNHGAKNTILMNYLPDAKNHGAEIFTQASVRYLEKKGDQWLVHYQILNSGREAFSSDTLVVSADTVILAAGSLGSTEILLRSQAKGLPLSTQLGKNFSGNGDVLAFAYNNDQEINGIGWGHKKGEDVPNANVGPCITGIIDMRATSDLEKGMILEEGSIPGGLAGILPGVMAAAAGAIGKDTDSGLMDNTKEIARQAVSLVAGARHGAVRNTQTFLVMSHDGSDGKMLLEKDRLRIAWPGIGKREHFKAVGKNLQKATEALGGTYVKNPIWNKLVGQDLVTVHPLGGCSMSDHADKGVVNHKSQVYSGTAGTDVYANLYVCDGAVMPRSLGVNPLLTISALAERSIALLAADRGWKIDYTFKKVVATMEKDPKVGIQFTESMKGFFAMGADSFQAGFDQGSQNDSKLEFILTVTSNDSEAMLKEPEHRAQMAGTVIAPALSATPLVASEAEFRLFVINPNEVGTRNMVYNMMLTADDGSKYRFNGYKTIHDDSGFDLWSDTTTLYVTLWRQEGGGEKQLGKGILHIKPLDFLKQMTTFKALNAKSVSERLKAIAGFGGFFAGALYETYGGILAKANVFDPKAEPRKKRHLELPAPESHFFKTDDNVQLRLIRYQGGKKGPVVLIPGMGVSTGAFTMDTLDVSLAEFLCAQDYDVWMFDHRASSDLAVSKTQFTLDEMARFDHPAAIAKVIQISECKDVQVISHCVGSATFLMSVLGGHLKNGVRSAILSQFTTHVESIPLLKIKTGAYLPNFLHSLGVDVLSTEFDSNSGWVDQMYDKLLKLYPTQKGQTCDSPVCRRIRFMWGEVFSHEQLNYATHRAIHEIFGDGNMSLFEHLGMVFRKGHLVDHKGNDVYLPHAKRISFPTSIIHGDKNTLFLPEGSEKTVKFLSDANGIHTVQRKLTPGYGHLDSFIGKNAYLDIFPYLLSELNKHNI